mmetsp:Transcript_2907/g.6194  ORF Transcript_2907/g.6194 Transcript_2907/m.6194 type:complete len:280 (-) Transcript_2907:435-1274(-)
MADSLIERIAATPPCNRYVSLLFPVDLKRWELAISIPPVTGGRVAQNGFNLLHVLVCHLFGHRHGLQVVFNLFHFCRAQQHAGNIGILGDPRQGQLGNGTVQLFFGIFGQFHHLVQFSRLLPTLKDCLEPFVALLRSARALGDLATVVFASQEATGKRRPGGCSNIVGLFEERKVLCFKTLPVKHVILGLFHLWSNQSLFSRNPKGFGDLLCAPFRCAPRHSLATAHQVRHALDNTFGRRERIRSVTVQNVHVVQLQALEGCIEAFNEMLATQAPFIYT